MKLPTLALTPAESRDRQGVVEPEIAGIAGEVVQTPAGAAWSLWRGLGNASLLLSPDGSFDQDGPVEPSIQSGVSVVAGEYGQAWQLDTTGRRISVPREDYIPDNSSFTVMIRVHDVEHDNIYMVSSGGTSTGVQFGSHFSASSSWLFWLAGTLLSAPGRWWDALAGLALSFDGAEARAYVNGSMAQSEGVDSPAMVSSLSFGGGLGVLFEAGVVFSMALSDAEIQRISQMPRRWEWGPDSTLSAPLATLPASLLIRATEDDITTTHHVTGLVEDVPATFGNHGTVTCSDGELVIGTTRNTDVMGVLAYPDELTPGEVGHLSGLASWSWQAVSPRFGDIQYIPRPSPVTVRYQPRPSPIAIGYQPRPSPIAIGYEIRTTPEDD